MSNLSKTTTQHVSALRATYLTRYNIPLTSDDSLYSMFIYSYSSPRIVFESFQHLIVRVGDSERPPAWREGLLT